MIDLIYNIHIKDRKSVIWVKDYQIFEDYETRQAIKFLNYSKSPTFHGFLLEDNNDEETMEVPITHTGQKVNSKRDKEQDYPNPRMGQKVSARKEEHPASRACKSRKFITEHLSPSTTRVNNAKNELESQDSYVGIKSMDTTSEQREQNP